MASAIALSNLGHALARAGRWDAARDALRRAAEARDALVTAGVASRDVSARGWSDLAALLAATGPLDEARDALSRVHEDDAAADGLRSALDETRALLALDEGASAASDASPTEPAAPLALLDLDDPPRATAHDTRPEPDAAGERDALDLPPAWDASHTDRAVDERDDEIADLATLLALAGGAPEPEIEPMELDGGDSLDDALDAAVHWSDAEPEAIESYVVPPDAHPQRTFDATDADDGPVPDELFARTLQAPNGSGTRRTPSSGAHTAGLPMLDEEPASATPMPSVGAGAHHTSGHDPDDEGTAHADAQDDAIVVLTPGVDLTDDAPGDRVGRRAASGPAGRLAAIDAIVDLTERGAAPKRGGLLGFVRRLTGR